MRELGAENGEDGFCWVGDEVVCMEVIDEAVEF